MSISHSISHGFYIYNIFTLWLYLTCGKHSLALNTCLYGVNWMHHSFPKCSSDSSPQKLLHYYINRLINQLQPSHKSYMFYNCTMQNIRTAYPDKFCIHIVIYYYTSPKYQKPLISFLSQQYLFIRQQFCFQLLQIPNTYC